MNQHILQARSFLGENTFSLLKEAFREQDMQKALKLIASVLGKAIGEKLKPEGGMNIVKNRYGINHGIRYFVGDTTGAIRFNFSPSNTVESVDIWLQTGNSSNPDIHINTSQVSIVKIIPFIAKQYRNPQPGLHDIDLNEQMAEHRQLIGEAQVEIDGEVYKSASDAIRELLQAGLSRAQVKMKTGASEANIYRIARELGVTVSVGVEKGSPEQDVDPEVPKIIKKVPKFANPDEVFDDLADLVDMIIKKLSPALIVTGAPGTGKSQPHSSLVLTREGWKTMGDIRVGDEVITPAGSTAKVLKLHPQGERKDVFEITLTNGRKARCTLDHLWKVKNSRWKQGKEKESTRILSTQEIINFYSKNKTAKLSIPFVIPPMPPETKLVGREEMWSNCWSTVSKIQLCLENEECSCIEIDSPDHLYITNDFIVTHNTFSITEQIVKKGGMRKDVDWSHVKGTSSPMGLYRHLFENKDRLIVFDDCDDVLKDVRMTNILKGALDTSPVREISWLSKTTFNPDGMSSEEYDANLNEGKLPSRFEFTGQVIFISNMTYDKIASSPAAALVSRAFTIDITLSQSDVLKRIRTIIDNIMPDASTADKKAALAYMEKNIKDGNNNEELSIRTFIKATMIVQSGSKNAERLIARYAP